MRTTLVLDDALMRFLKECALHESKTLTEIVSETLNRGLNGEKTAIKPWVCASFDMGGGFDYSKAWEKIDELESLAVADKMELRK